MRARAFVVAAADTRLYPGDLLAAPPHEIIRPSTEIEISFDEIGTLRNPLGD